MPESTSTRATNRIPSSKSVSMFSMCLFTVLRCSLAHLKERDKFTQLVLTGRRGLILPGESVLLDPLPDGIFCQISLHDVLFILIISFVRSFNHSEWHFRSVPMIAFAELPFVIKV